MSVGHLVEDVSLAAKVKVRQDASRAHVGDGQAGLRHTGSDQSGLPLTETREEVRELRETTWGEEEIPISDYHSLDFQRLKPAEVKIKSGRAVCFL